MKCFMCKNISKGSFHDLCWVYGIGEEPKMKRGKLPFLGILIEILDNKIPYPKVSDAKSNVFQVIYVTDSYILCLPKGVRLS